MKFEKRWIRSLLTWGAIAAVVYFGNVQLQSWLGRRALEKTGLEVHQLEPGLQRASESGRLVLADLSAIWCSSCRTFDKKVLSDPEVRSLIEDRFVFVRVEYETDEGKAFRQRYDVKGFPTLLVLDAEGELVRRLPTTYDPAKFLALLRRIPTHGAHHGGTR